jgi:hypothetical protein
MNTLLLKGSKEFKPDEIIMKIMLIMPIFHTGVTNGEKNKISLYLKWLSTDSGFLNTSEKYLRYFLALV